MGQSKLWSRNLIVLMGLNFSSALSFWLIMVKITQFASDTYGVSSAVAGFAISAYILAALFTRVFFGAKIDVWGVKRSIVIGSVVNTVAMLLYLIPMGFIPLMIVRVIHGFGFAIMSGSCAAGAVLVLPADRYGEGIGYFSMMQALATGVGPFVAILLTNIFNGYFAMFVFAAAVMVVALFTVPLLKIPQNARPAKHINMFEEVKEQGIGAFVQLSVVPIASVLLLVYFGYSGIISFVTSYASERGLDDAMSFFFVVYAIVVLISRPPVGRRIDRLGENSTVYYCLVSFVVGFVLLAFAVNGMILLVSAAFVGVGIGATQSIVQAVIARDAPPEELGKANSTFFMSMDLGSGIGPVIIGAALPYVGYSAIYLMLAVVGVLAIVVYYFAHGRHKGPVRKR